MLALAMLSAIVIAALAYQSAGEYLDAHRYPPPGKLIETKTATLHLQALGTGTPTVILESGIAGSSLGWTPVGRQIAAFTRVCSYDRAGLGWSKECISPRTVDHMVAELSAALEAAQLTAPYILVGHSFGGLLIRAFAHARPQEIAGMVFVDPVTLLGWANPDANQLRRVQTGARLARRGALLARFGIVRAALQMLISGSTRMPKLLARASASQGCGVLERLAGEVRKLPSEAHPIVRAHWSRPQSFRALANYLECLPASARLALGMAIPQHIPFVVLSAASATSAELAERDSWVEQSSAGRHINVPETGHWLQLERPDVVVDVVRDLVGERRP